MRKKPHGFAARRTGASAPPIGIEFAFAKGANVRGEPVSHPWGLRDFRVIDLEGNEITFGQTFE